MAIESLAGIDRILEPSAGALLRRRGVGYLGLESISRADFPVVQAIVLILASFYIVLTLLADLLNAFLDPRIRVA
jgi:peptide/nickel transport system permease protein